MDNIELIINDLSKKLELEKPKNFSDSSLGLLENYKEDATQDILYQKVQELCEKLETKAENSIVNTLDISLSSLHSKEELAQNMIQDLKNGNNALKNFKNAIMKQWIEGTKLSARADIIPQTQATEELIKLLLNESEKVSSEFYQYIYSKALDKHLELKSTVLLVECIEDLAQGYFLPFEWLSDEIKMYNTDSENFDKQILNSVNNFFESSKWEKSFKEDFKGIIYTHLLRNGNILSNDQILMPLLENGREDSSLGSSLSTSVDKVKNNQELRLDKYEKDIKEIAYLNDFQAYCHEEIEAFRNNNSQYYLLFGKILKDNNEQIKKRLEQFVKDELVFKIMIKLKEFFNKRKELQHPDLLTIIDNKSIKELDNHLTLAGYRFAVNKLVMLKKGLIESKSIDNEFKDQFDFLSKQDEYLKKVCQLLGVNRSIIELNSDMKYTPMDALSNVFASAHVTPKQNGIYPMSFRRLSQYVLNHQSATHIILIKHLLHEATHIKQMEDNRLQYLHHPVKGVKIVWEGVDYTEHKMMSLNDHSSYLSLPWEVEARASEERYNEILELDKPEDSLLERLKSSFFN